MPGALYDSGWVPVASGAIQASVDLSDYREARIFLGASGTNGAVSGTASFVAGAGTPIPWLKSTPAYPMAPYATGTYTVANPSANTWNVYYVGGATTGSAQLSPFMPMALQVNLLAGASSWARVIVEAR